MALNKDDMKNKFSNAWSKTVDFSKKAAGDIQRGAKELSDKTKDEMHAYRMKKYNPLYSEEFEREDFKYPSVVRIAQDSENKDIDVCEGAIGWRETFDGVEVLHIYSKYVDLANIEFLPSVNVNNTYCVDPFNQKRYISYNEVFLKAIEEKLAELEHIAYSLGAKYCSVEVIESNNSDTSKSAGASMNGVTFSHQSGLTNGNKSGGKTESFFAGHDNPTRPTLKWFSHNDSIKKLIEMRCSDFKSVQKRKLELKGSTMVAMSKGMAAAIDKIANIGGAVSMEKQSAKEHDSVLIFEVEF